MLTLETQQMCYYMRYLAYYLERVGEELNPLSDKQSNPLSKAEQE